MNENVVACMPRTTFADKISMIEEQQNRIMQLLMETHFRFFNTPTYKIEPADCIGYDDKLSGIVGSNTKIIELLIDLIDRA